MKHCAAFSTAVLLLLLLATSASATDFSQCSNQFEALPLFESVDCDSTDEVLPFRLGPFHEDCPIDQLSLSQIEICFDLTYCFNGVQKGEVDGDNRYIDFEFYLTSPNWRETGLCPKPFEVPEPLGSFQIDYNIVAEIDSSDGLFVYGQGAATFVDTLECKFDNSQLSPDKISLRGADLEQEFTMLLGPVSSDCLPYGPTVEPTADFSFFVDSNSVSPIFSVISESDGYYLAFKVTGQEGWFGDPYGERGNGSVNAQIIFYPSGTVCVSETCDVIYELVPAIVARDLFVEDDRVCVWYRNPGYAANVPVETIPSTVDLARLDDYEKITARLGPYPRDICPFRGFDLSFSAPFVSSLSDREEIYRYSEGALEASTVTIGGEDYGEISIPIDEWKKIPRVVGTYTYLVNADMFSNTPEVSTGGTMVVNVIDSSVKDPCSNLAKVCAKCNSDPSATFDCDKDGNLDCGDTDGDGIIDACESSFGGIKGDPHVVRWNRESFDFHGECDLVMLHSDNLNNGKVFDLHIRTKIVTSFSSIESAALRVGDEIIEIDANKFYYKGTEFGDEGLPVETSQFTISEAKYTPGYKVRRDYHIVLNDQSTIIVRKTKNYLSLSIQGHHHDFEDSHGLLGDFFTGNAVGRDGRLMTEGDWEAYGMEWQVLPEEPKLFRQLREPQLPHARCKMPTVLASMRRLRGQDPDFYKAAEKACAIAGEEEFKDCISDVLLTGALAAAEAY